MPRLFRWFAAALVAAGGAVHLSLYLDGYQSIPRVGPLFLLNVVAAVLIAIALAARPIGIVALAAAGFALATMASLGLSRTIGLLGFREAGLDVRSAATLAVEALTLSVLGLWFLSTRPAAPALAGLGRRRGDRSGQAA